MTPDLNPVAHHIKPASVIKHDNLMITLNIQDCEICFKGAAQQIVLFLHVLFQTQIESCLINVKPMD